MLIIFGILVLIASVILGLIILIQNPKGGGLSASFGGIGNQLMGVKKTTDILEKGTWLFAGIVAILCLTSAFFIPKASGNEQRDRLLNEAPAGTSAAPKQNSVPLQTNPQPPAKPS
ncbi:MAG: preprotein translocase subunit SecG [Ginsengibacter sp.]